MKYLPTLGKKGATQQYLAKLLHKPQSFVSKYENGERRLDVVEFCKITGALGESPIDLLQKSALTNRQFYFTELPHLNPSFALNGLVAFTTLVVLFTILLYRLKIALSTGEKVLPFFDIHALTIHTCLLPRFSVHKNHMRKLSYALWH